MQRNLSLSSIPAGALRYLIKPKDLNLCANIFLFTRLLLATVSSPSFKSGCILQSRSETTKPRTASPINSNCSCFSDLKDIASLSREGFLKVIFIFFSNLEPGTSENNLRDHLLQASFNFCKIFIF
ncbi:MAG: hypothetical protein DDT22_00698 [candidate division WS2 bacterium]|nr:hypothetical protein [Candidatus Lithacetigena glycinireducens]